MKHTPFLAAAGLIASFQAGHALAAAHLALSVALAAVGLIASCISVARSLGLLPTVKKRKRATRQKVPPPTL